MEAATPERPRSLTLDEYFELDALSDERYEYYEGEVVMMAGGSPAHDTMTYNVPVAIESAIADRPCRGFSSHQRIAIPRKRRHAYSDGGLLCGDEPRYETERGVAGLLNPQVLIEVLSPSTQRKDRGKKFDAYSMIESLRHYLLFEQDEARVTVLTRDGLDDAWRVAMVTGLDGMIPLKAVGIELSMRAIYKNVTFPPASQADAD